MTSAKEIIAAAMSLPAEERVQIAEELWASVEREGDEDGMEGSRDEILAAWAEEVERRIDRDERGEGESIPHARAMEELQRAINSAGKDNGPGMESGSAG